MAPPMHRDGGSGIWGYPTSTMDWCEENYAITTLVAEFWNSLSNFWLIVPPILASRIILKTNMVERRYGYGFLVLSLVGFGSFAFHCTLLHSSQLLDELPMVHGTCFLIYLAVDCNGRPNRLNLLLATGLFMIAMSVSVVYVLVPNPLIFLWAYGLLAACLVICCVYKCWKFGASWRLLIFANLCYNLGFILWNIDNEFCPQIRQLRSLLPGPLAPVLQLHAWWHTMAGIGTYFSIVFSVHLRFVCLGYHHHLRYYFYCLPFLEKGEPVLKSSNGVSYDSNGNAVPAGKRVNQRPASVGNLARLL